MKVLASLALAACVVASPAFAGPAGTGLTFTEEVAKKNLQKRATKVEANTTCATPAETPAKDTAAAVADPNLCRAS